MAMPPLQSPIMLATTTLSPRRSEVISFESFPSPEDFDPIVEGICTNPKCQHQRNSIDCYGCDPIARTCCKCHSPLSSGTSARTFRPSSRASSIGSVATGPSVPPSSKKNWPDNLLADWPDTEKNDYVRTWALNGSDSIASPDRGGATSPLMGSPVESRRGLSLSGLLTLPVETDETPVHIANLMEGPDPMDGKWTCKYDDCYKRFGRKENLKWHIQTHLRNRSYRCSGCSKCFVRLHDLKRHRKIHGNHAKPYPCMCGASFARHDALMRHRQRGMCIGTSNEARRPVKRGRPKDEGTMAMLLEHAKRVREQEPDDHQRAAKLDHIPATDQIYHSPWSFTPLQSPTFSNSNTPSLTLSPRLSEPGMLDWGRDSKPPCKIPSTPKAFDDPILSKPNLED